jgi:hypothetical protein
MSKRSSGEWYVTQMQDGRQRITIHKAISKNGKSMRQIVKGLDPQGTQLELLQCSIGSRKLSIGRYPHAARPPLDHTTPPRVLHCGANVIGKELPFEPCTACCDDGSRMTSMSSLVVSAENLLGKWAVVMRYHGCSVMGRSVRVSNHIPVLVNDGTRCPKCGGEKISVLVATAPRCFQCLTCRHTWDEPYLRPARDRRTRPQDSH